MSVQHVTVCCAAASTPSSKCSWYALICHLQCMCAVQVLIKQYSTSVNPVEVKILAAESTKLPKVCSSAVAPKIEGALGVCLLHACS